MSDNDFLQMVLGTDLEGLFDRNAPLNSAMEDPSGGGGNEFSFSFLGMQSLINIRQYVILVTGNPSNDPISQYMGQDYMARLSPTPPAQSFPSISLSLSNSADAATFLGGNLPFFYDSTELFVQPPVSDTQIFSQNEVI